MRKSECCHENGRCHGHVWKCIGWGLLGVIGFVVLMAVLGLVIMALWNALVPEIFHLTTIGYWQAIGLAVLSRLLFGGMGFHHMHKMHHGRRGCKCYCHCHSEKECCDDKTHEGECCKKEEESPAQV